MAEAGARAGRVAQRAASRVGIGVCFNGPALKWPGLGRLVRPRRVRVVNRAEPASPAGDPRFSEGQRRGNFQERQGGGERRWSGPRPQQDYRPYLSPYFNLAFYPDDTGFSALVKAMRASCRTLSCSKSPA